MFEYIILGAVQGIAEWLPVSSEGITALIKIHFFSSDATIVDTVKEALFLHLGTALAAIVYFHKDIYTLSREAIHYKTASETNKRTIVFLIVTTIISGVLGLILLIFLKLVSDTSLTNTGARIFTAIIGVMLLVTAGLQLWNSERSGKKTTKDLNGKDNIILGIAQGFAPIPGLSRSGLTVAALLLCGYDKKDSLRLSFLMSIPIVLAGNVMLNIGDVSSMTFASLAGLVTSFIFGIITINILLRIAQKINFGYFVLFFAILTFAAAIIQ